MNKHLLILIVSSLLSLDVALATQLTPAVRRTLARQLVNIVATKNLIPLTAIGEQSAEYYVHDYCHQFVDMLVHEERIINSYAQKFSKLVVNKRTGGTIALAFFAGKLERTIETTAREYAKLVSGVDFSKKKAMGAHLLVALRKSLQLTKDALAKRVGGEIRLHHLYEHLSDVYQDRADQKEDKLRAQDMSAYLRHFPQLDQGMTLAEFMQVVTLASNPKITYGTVEKEIKKILAASPDTSLADTKNKVRMSDIFDMPNLSFSPALQEDDVQWDFDITYPQLLETKFLVGITTQFLIAMDWSWHEFSAMLYPNDSEQAALFVADYFKNILDEDATNNIQTVLQQKRDELSNKNKATAIDAFLAELPTLLAKANFIKTATLAHAAGNEPATPEREQFLDLVFDGYDKDFIRWGYMSLESFMSGIYLDKIIDVFTQLGFTEKQLRELIFPPYVFDKIVLGKIATEQDVNAMRILLIKNLKELKASSVSKDMPLQGKELTMVEKAYESLPMIMQRDGFLKKIASGSVSKQKLLNVMAAVETDSMYYPFAVKLRQELDGLSERRRKTLLNVIIKDIQQNKKLNTAMSKLREFVEQQISEREEHTSSEQEHPVKLINPQALIQQQKKYLRSLQRESRRDIPAEESAMLQITEEQRKQQVQHAVEQQTKRELAQQITKLSHMLGKTSLPADTSVWMRLRAIITYADAEVEQLAQRADLQDRRERFFALVVQDSTIMPKAEDLASIGSALQKHIQKRKGLTKTERSRIIDTVHAEIYALQQSLQIER